MGDRPSRPVLHDNVAALLRRPGIGHNQGPPLDMSYEGWVWRRAVAKAWKTPPREIALRRMDRAEAVGLSYRDYTGVLMDRGRSVTALIFSLAALLEEKASGWGRGRRSQTVLRPEALAKFATLRPGHLLVMADGFTDQRLVGDCDEAELQMLLQSMLPDQRPDLLLVDGRARRGPHTADPRLVPLRAWLQRRGIVATEAIMIGLGGEDLWLAESCELALFKPAWEYFSPVPVR